MISHEEIQRLRSEIQASLARGDEFEYQAATDRGVVLIAKFVYAGTFQVEVYWLEESGKPEMEDLMEFSRHVDAIVGRSPERGIPGPDYFAIMGGGVG